MALKYSMFLMLVLLLPEGFHNFLFQHGSKELYKEQCSTPILVGTGVSQGFSLIALLASIEAVSIHATKPVSTWTTRTKSTNSTSTSLVMRTESDGFPGIGLLHIVPMATFG